MFFVVFKPSFEHLLLLWLLFVKCNGFFLLACVLSDISKVHKLVNFSASLLIISRSSAIFVCKISFSFGYCSGCDQWFLNKENTERLHCA